MAKRQYTDREKGAALAYVNFVGGNTREASKVLKIPHTTLQDWVKERGTNEDVAEIRTNSSLEIEKLLEVRPELRPQPRLRRKHTAPKNLKTWHNGSYLYIVRCADTDFYKVGISKINPRYRLAQLQTGCPYELTMQHLFKCAAPEALEIEVHGVLAQHHVRGEWFELTEGELEALVVRIATKVTEGLCPQLRLAG
jgi:hypothetical protein